MNSIESSKVVQFLKALHQAKALLYLPPRFGGRATVARFSWYVLRTHHQQEQRASRELANQRIAIQLMLGRTEKRRLSDGLLVAKIRPIFPRYLFAKLDWDRDYRKVKYTRGIHSFVGYNEGMERPPIVRNSVIVELKSRLTEVYGLDVVLLDRPLTVEPHDIVRVLFGPWRDQLGTVQSVDEDRERVTLLLHLFGVPTTKTFDRDILTVVEWGKLSTTNSKSKGREYPQAA